MEPIPEERTNDSLMKSSFTLLILFICCTPFLLKAQPTTDTIRLSIQDVEKRFIDSNYLLLASRYNVDAQKALTEQAKLWDNPVLNTDQVLMANGKAFPYGKNPDGSYSGQYYIQVQQLIKTAGKRGKLINLSNTNVKISEWELQDVLRNLRYQLHIDYYSIAQQLAVMQVYREQQSQLLTLLNGMQAELKEGNIARKDYIRLQALQLSLQQDMTDLQKSMADNETDLKTLLSMTDRQFIVPSDPLPVLPSDVPALDSITRAGQTNNPYYQLQVTQTLFQQQNLVYQKALRVPDITLGPNFDRNSNFAPNYVGLGISLPLPLLNKNQGNIKAAEFGVRQQQSLTVNAEKELENNLTGAYRKLLYSGQQNSEKQQTFYKDYDQMYQKVLNSYKGRQLSLLEFLDFFNDYTQTLQRRTQQQLNLQLAKEELNYHAGIDIVK